MVLRAINLFLIFVFLPTILFSQENFKSTDYELINLTLTEIESDINKEKQKALSNLNKEEDRIKINKYLSKRDTIYLKNKLLKKINHHFFEKIKTNCITTKSNCKHSVFNKKEKRKFYKNIFSDIEIENYIAQIEFWEKEVYPLNKSNIKSNKIKLYDKDKKNAINWCFLAKPLYTKDRRYAFISFVFKGESKIYFFKKVKENWKLKWKKENLVLGIKI